MIQQLFPFEFRHSSWDETDTIDIRIDMTDIERDGEVFMRGRQGTESDAFIKNNFGDIRQLLHQLHHGHDTSFWR